MAESDGNAEQLGKRAKSKKRPKADAYLQQITDKKLKTNLRHKERVYLQASKTALKAQEWLAPAEGGWLEAEGMEETWRFKQQDIVAAAEQGSGHKVIQLDLPELGPYKGAFSRSGRHMVLGGARGHLAVVEWQRSHLTCEVQVSETTHAVTFLHNELFFAAAQKKYVYIYDKRGVEVHCLREHLHPHALEFLPHHLLLCSVGDQGILHYQDTSTGQIVAQHKTRLGSCDAMCQNPYNAVLCLGHANGTLTMWTPNLTTPAVKMLCHKGPVKAVAVDPTGHQLVTAGLDCQVKVWDVRTFKPLHAYFANSPATSLDISQKGLLAVGQGRRVQVWKDALASKAQSPYLTHQVALGGIHSLKFCPYEDVLGVGSAGGVSTLLVPGAAEANFDSFVANPYQGRKERQEQEVAQLLDKLQPDTIVLEPDRVGQLVREPAEVLQQRRAAAAAANAARRREALAKSDEKGRMKGKNKPTRRQKKKQQNIIEEKKPKVKAQQEEEERMRLQQKAVEKQKVLESVPRALHRLYK